MPLRWQRRAEAAHASPGPGRSTWWDDHLTAGRAESATKRGIGVSDGGPDLFFDGARGERRAIVAAIRRSPHDSAVVIRLTAEIGPAGAFSRQEQRARRARSLFTRHRIGVGTGRTLHGGGSRRSSSRKKNVLRRPFVVASRSRIVGETSMKWQGAKWASAAEHGAPGSASEP
jgi:hypothetical protein